jgi:phosphoglycerate dehydrogenase-like enzyme
VPCRRIVDNQRIDSYVGRVSAHPPVVAVLVADRDDRPTGLEALRNRVELRFVDEAGLADGVAGAQGLLLWDFFSSAVRDVWDRCGDLEWIHVAAAGVDTLLFPALRDSDVTVTNARGTFDRPIAEFVLASVLARAKRLHESRDLQREHVWRHRETLEVRGSTALVVGTGAIGREIARVLGAVGMRVRGAGRAPAASDPDFGQVLPSDDLPAHVGWADHVVNATPLTDATRGLFDARVFAAMRPGTHFVNIGRGPSVVEADLVAALEAGRPGAASLDVFECEPLPADSPLWDAPGVVVSAHMSGDVVGWRDTLARQFLDNALRWLDGDELVNVVDKRLGYVRGAA